MWGYYLLKFCVLFELKATQTMFVRCTRSDFWMLLNITVRIMIYLESCGGDWCDYSLF